MDKQAIALLIPLFALMIPIVAIIGSMVLKIQKAKLEEARLHAGDPGMVAEVEELRQELQQVRGEVAEMQERLDFTERMIAGGPKGA